MIFWPWLIAAFYGGALLGFVFAALLASARGESEPEFSPETIRRRMKRSGAGFVRSAGVGFNDLKSSHR